MSKKENKKENKEENKEEITGSVGGFLLEIVKIFLMAVIIILPIRVFLFQPFFVQGASMEPNFHNGEYLLVNELGYKETDLGAFKVEQFKDVKRGMVMVFRYPLNETQFFIKRIIGLPGEKVTIKEGEIYIYNKENPEGMRLNEDYLPKNIDTEPDASYEVEENSYFVMGDNRSHSSDSRRWGTVNANEIIGRVFLRAWPLDKIDFFK